MFRILDIVPIIKDILAYILAIPFLIFSPLYEFFSGFGKYFAIICWSDNGFGNDVSSFLGLIDVDELEESASFEEDVETSEKNTKKDIDEANKEAEEDAEELKDDAENF